jgi:protein-arginine kinase activator protein McsA
MKEETVSCADCSTEISWLEVFPKGICVECYARNTEHLTASELYSQVMEGFGNGKVINKSKTRRK